MQILGVPLTPDFTAVGLAYFAQASQKATWNMLKLLKGALALAALAKPFYLKEKQAKRR